MKTIVATLLLALFLVVPQAHAQSNTTFTRIQFAPGASGAQVSGVISGDVSAGYILGAAAGQTLAVSTTNGTLTVVSPSGQPLIRGPVLADPIRAFSDILSETGDYIVYVSLPSGSPTASFTLNVSITGTPRRTDTAERVRFQPGTTGAQVTGTLFGGQINNYVLYASAGQWLSLTVDNGTLTVVSPSGQPLVRGNVTAQPVRSFSQTLPETGDYRVSVLAPPESPAFNYTLGISITGTASGINAPQRVRFNVGATSGSVTGQLVSGEIDTYTLGAFAGQTMTISAPNTYITLISPSGVLLQANVANGLTQVLPESGDYYAQFSSVAGSQTINYSATFGITGNAHRTSTTERIRFQTGASGAQVFGTVSPTVEHRYILFAFAGQFMQISVDSASLTVISPSGQPLVRGNVTAQPVRNFGQRLPETGDYTVITSAPAGVGAVNYTLTVTITP